MKAPATPAFSRRLLPALLAAILAVAPNVARTATPAPAARLTIVVDNSVARGGVKAVWGFACLVEARGHTVLFDTGADPALLEDNLAALKIDPAKIEAVVISHGHGDHTWGAPGLGRLAKVPVYTPRSFDGLQKTAAALEAPGLVHVPVTTATTLFEGIAISEPQRFGQAAAGPGTWEQCLTVDTPEGLVVVVGCAHPGILPMLEKVKRQSGRPIHCVLGGFHLLELPAAEVRAIATRMQTLGVQYAGATHCTGDAAIHVFRDVFGNRYVGAGVGAVIKLPLAPRKL